MSGLRANRGQTVAELLGGFLLMIPVAILCIDVAYTLLASRSNEELAQNASRLAANQPNEKQAVNVALNTVGQFKKWAGMHSVKVDSLTYNAAAKTVAVRTKMVVLVPIPVPGFAEQTFVAEAVQRVVGIPTP